MEPKHLLAVGNSISKYVINGHGDPATNTVFKFYAHTWIELPLISFWWKVSDQECYHSNSTSVYFFVFGVPAIVDACKALNHCVLFTKYSNIT